ELKTVRFAVDGDSKRIVLRLDATVAYSLGRLSAPERLYLDLVDTRPGPALRGGRIAVDDALVRLIRVGQPQAGITRAVLDLKEPAESDVFWLDAPPRLVVVLRRPAPAPPPTPPEPIPAMPAAAE